MSPNLDVQTSVQVACPACDAARVRTDASLGRRLRVADPGALRVCKACGLAWIDARRGVGAPVVYEEEYFDAFEQSRSFQGGMDALPAHMSARLDRMQALNGHRAGRLLEVGCGFGQFLVNARDRGWQVHGTDVSRWVARGIAERYGIGVEVGDILDVTLPDAVDVVHMNHVLEHLADPAAALRRLHTALRPGGLLAIEVPNEVESLYEQVRWRVLGRTTPSLSDTSPHLFFFTPRALVRLVEGVGFGVLATETERRDRDEASRFPLGGAVKRAIYALERRLTVGPNIVLFATR